MIVSVASDGFTNFETEPVRPLALSPDGRYLYALNTADDRLEIFNAEGERLRSVGETSVGLRPVAIALRGTQAWVVNHLSDSVSVVDVSDPARPKVVHTLQVGDEPRGIVVAGPRQERIFVATAYRGETLTPGIGRAQVWMFDALRPQAAPALLTLFGSKPRALAASHDGRHVYAAVYLSGNGTTTVSGEDAVRLGRAPQLYLDAIPYAGIPKQGPIVRRDHGRWLDDQNRDWTAAVPFDLPDYDVFVIDATADNPKVVESISNVGTVLFNMSVQPGSEEIWVSNTDASNFVPHEPRLQGKFARNQVTRISSAGKSGRGVQAIDLNLHVDRDSVTSSARERDLSLAQPLDLVFEPDGGRAYVAAFGSGKVGVLDREGRVVHRIAVGFGPGGLALDSRRQRLYVLNHLDATISTVDLRRQRAMDTAALRYDPTPTVVKAGRQFFYDATSTSRHGDLSCASCHVFGDTDGLAWDLGDPKGRRMDYPIKLRKSGPLEPRQSLHPLKGPMVTQSLRGLAATAPFHWRGDRFGVAYAPGEDVSSFKDFNPAFVELLGRSEEISEPAMDAFARFILTIRYPPNPNQRLDRLLDAEQKAGFEFFTGPFLSAVGVENCVGCHSLPTGTNRLVNFEHTHVGRDMKTAHLRNVYDKIGRFNAPGPQVSGFGLIHDGTFDTVANFLRMEGFVFPGKTEAERDVIRRQLHEYIVAFDTGMAPAVGRQLTVTGEPGPDQRQLLHLLEIRSAAEECDLTARVWEGRTQRGWLYRDYVYHGDRRGEAPLDSEALLGRYRPGAEPITFTCVPPGDGNRSALDRDLNGILDGDELSAVGARARDQGSATLVFSSNLSVCFLAVIFFLSGCAGLPVRGSVGGQNIETRVDSEAARYFLTSYLGGRRSDIDLDQRIDRTYRNGLSGLPDRIELKRLSDEFSVDFAALYFADRVARAPNNRDLRAAYARVYDDLQKAVAGTGFLSNELAAKYEIVLVPGYLYKRHPVTGADLAAPRAALRRAGIAQFFVETFEDGAIETNAEIVLSAIRARSQGGRRLVLVSVSKSGAEVALALTRLGSAGAGSVAAWVNIAGALQGSPLADESLLQLEDVVGKVDVAGVESLSTARSRERFNSFRIPPHVLVINYIGIPLSGTISLLARSGFLQLRAHGPNDGLSLLPDLIIPGGVTLAELGRDHFLLDDRIDVSTIALTLTVMSYLEQGWRPSQVLKMSDLDAIP